MSGREEVWWKVSGDEAGETEAQLFRVWCESTPLPPHLAELGPLPLPTGIKDGSREAVQGGLALIQAGDEGGLGQGDSDGERLRNS